MTDASLKLRLAATAGSVPIARRALADLCAQLGLAPDLIGSVKVAVSEACTNVVVHAYLDEAQPGTLELEAHRGDGRLCVTVRDYGRGMVPRLDSPGLGLGLPLIASLATDVKVHGSPGDGVTEVVMEFACDEPVREPCGAERRAY